MRIAVVIAVLCGVAIVAQAQTNAPALNAEDAAAAALRLTHSYEQLQQQQQAAVQALQQARDDAAASAKQNAETLAVKLKQLDDAMLAQRQRELDTVQSAHRLNLQVIGIVAGVGFIGLLVVLFFLMRLLKQRTETHALQTMGAPGVYGNAPSPAWPSGQGQLMSPDPAQQASARFLGTMERLEKRLDEIETSMTGEQPAHPQPIVAPAPEPPTVLHFEVPATADTRAALLTGKGRALLNLQQFEEALACFEEAAVLDPSNSEVFIKKGTALEKLERWNDAINAYDQAIDLNNFATVAYLYKGGVLSRLERYDAALECYEQALSMQNRAENAVSG